MRYRSLGVKTLRSAPQDAESINAQLLLRGGFVRQEMAGVYSWLPLGLRVLRKVEGIVREEMSALGSQEILMSALQPKENWLTTDRWDSMDVLFKVPSQTGKEYALGSTHEEIVTPLVQSYVQSYKDLPTCVFQIQTKFRDELRAKSGVLRGREFVMKDMYSFHRTQEDLDAYYAKAAAAYFRVFERCGLKAKMVEASGGAFSKKVSHEFQVLTDAGEDMVLTSPSWKYGQNQEVATLKEGDACPDHASEKLEWKKGVEVGNIFQLGTRFSDAFGMTYTAEDGTKQPVIMGCYGIGVSRLVGTIVEASHDDRGMIWPESVAPFRVHIVTLKGKTEESQARIDAAAQELYDELLAQKTEVLWDDRDASPGEKLADADLLGLPIRVLFSEKTMAEGAAEVKRRSEAEATMVKTENLLDQFLQ
jgi:prolyl-tRNA synthetase